MQSTTFATLDTITTSAQVNGSTSKTVCHGKHTARIAMQVCKPRNQGCNATAQHARNKMPNKQPNPISYRPTAEADEKLNILLAYYQAQFPTLNKQDIISKAIVELWKQVKEIEEK